MATLSLLTWPALFPQLSEGPSLDPRYKHTGTRAGPNSAQPRPPVCGRRCLRSRKRETARWGSCCWYSAGSGGGRLGVGELLTGCNTTECYMPYVLHTHTTGLQSIRSYPIPVPIYPSTPRSFHNPPSDLPLIFTHMCPKPWAPGIRGSPRCRPHPPRPPTIQSTPSSRDPVAKQRYLSPAWGDPPPGGLSPGQREEEMGRGLRATGFPKAESGPLAPPLLLWAPPRPR